MVKLGMANSRTKDFYDLGVMARQFEFGGPVLSAAIKATFERRRTALPSSPPLALTAEFGEATGKQAQWRAFLKKSGLNASESLNDVVKELDEFVMPVVEGITSGKALRHTWRPRGPWEPPA
jgi:Nucleotidyl transferase AbiEii toxin, Type IV TA system